MKTARIITFALGCLFLLSPLPLYWLIHGDYDRYMRIINGPYPLSALGGGPFQLWMDVLLVAVGLALLAVSFALKRKKKARGEKPEQ